MKNKTHLRVNDNFWFYGYVSHVMLDPFQHPINLLAAQRADYSLDTGLRQYDGDGVNTR
jgi:hypothetical protein